MPIFVLYKKVIISFLALFVVLFFNHASYATDVTEEYNLLRQAEIYKFSQDLFETGEYYRAITEAKRYYSLFPDGEYADDLYKLIGDSYLMAREWEDAISAYESFIFQFPTSQYVSAVYFNTAICCIKTQKYKKAEKLFERIIADGAGQDLNQSILWKILLLIQQNRLDEVESLLEDGSIRDIVLQKSGIIEKTINLKKNVKYKNPKLAGFMSAVLPGSGQAYNGRYTDALGAFVLNALFISGTWLAFDDDNAALGLACSIFAIGFYKGNIYGAVNGAYKYNRKIDEDIFRRSVENFGLYDRNVSTNPSIKVFFRFYFE